jgi:hypothetical protein
MQDESTINAVMNEAKANGVSVQRLIGYGKVLDARLLALESRVCQVIKTHERVDTHYPNATSVPLYLPRSEFADFLIYPVHQDGGKPAFYIIPRGVMTKDTMWSLESLEQYRDSWDVLQQRDAPTERHFTILNWQLKAVIEKAELANLEVTLVGRKNNRPWPRFSQRRILVGGRRCTVFSCTRLSNDQTNRSYEFVFLRKPMDKWGEFQLCIVRDNAGECAIFVLPYGMIPKTTTASLNNPSIQTHKNNWGLLSMSPNASAVTPLQWRQPKPKITPPDKEVPVALAKTMLQAKSHGLSVGLVSTIKRGVCLKDRCLYISNKRCQVMNIRSITIGNATARYVPLNIPRTDWAEFLIFFVRAELEDDPPSFYVVPRSRLAKRTAVSLTSSWLRDHKDAWHLLCESATAVD